jgi:hypothetical protein
MVRSFVACVATLMALAMPASASDTPKHGGILTFMIPADSPPSFDGHREATFATIHAVAPFYSVLIRANPDTPATSAPRSRHPPTTAAPTASPSATTSGFPTARR